MNRREAGLALLAAAFGPKLAMAQATPKTHVVKMWSDGGMKYYMPDFLKVAVGDTVQFVNMSGRHNTESVDGMIPEGTTPWNSQLEQTFELKITQPGVYGYKCTPHFAMGMVGIIVAGDAPANLVQAQSVKTPKKAKAVFDRLFAKVN